MAIRRMVHKSISISEQVNSLDEFTQLLFTWMIPHLDDFGKISGEPTIIKALVMPMSSRSVSQFEEALQKMVDINLIKRYEVDGKKIILFPTFDTHQTGLNKRTKSKYPDPPGNNSENFSEVPRNTTPIEANITENNLIKANGSEQSLTEQKESNGNKLNVANHSVGNLIVNPKTFSPESAEESAALEAWKALEPNHPWVFGTVYLGAVRKGLPANMFYQFVSEIKVSPGRDNGKVFTSKVESYFRKK